MTSQLVPKLTKSQIAIASLSMIEGLPTHTFHIIDREWFTTYGECGKYIKNFKLSQFGDLYQMLRSQGNWEGVVGISALMGDYECRPIQNETHLVWWVTSEHPKVDWDRYALDVLENRPKLIKESFAPDTSGEIEYRITPKFLYPNSIINIDYSEWSVKERRTFIFKVCNRLYWHSNLPRPVENNFVLHSPFFHENGNIVCARYGKHSHIYFTGNHKACHIFGLETT